MVWRYVGGPIGEATAGLTAATALPQHSRPRGGVGGDRAGLAAADRGVEPKGHTPRH